ncbi:flavin reductase family protein [Actinomadura rupiterrae]|uniref:flavin reductase family protein n=1 Tax=Actinomadura rupiterrae TaxID=559627 RepID=UPI0020A3F668|nr:flavin reductase family protein [Actinomadura rupiterrae]
MPGPSAEVYDSGLLRRAFGTFATGVTVVTCGGPNPHGMTANSFSSVSLDPPLVLVCVGRDATMNRMLRRSEYFGVSVLSAGQEPVARHFAGRRRALGAAQFDPVDWMPGELTRVPLIDGALAWFECRRWRDYDGGDHTIYTGRLLSMRRQEAGDALLFYDGRFRRVSPEPTEVPL